MDDLTKYTPKANIGYLTGISLGVNAVPDTSVLIDGPDCSFFKTDIIYGNHDIKSSLKSVENNHRMYYTGLTVNNVIKGHEDKIVKEFSRMRDDPNINFIFSTTFPMAEVLGIQYDMVLRDLGLEESSIEIKGSIKKDWIDGYAEVLLGLAKGLDLQNLEKKGNSVSIVGNMFDRFEGDCIGNINELKRIIESIGLKLDTIWFDGTSTKDLKKIENSSYIISLPYGRKAAKKVAQRTGAKLIETCVPFSIQSTDKFIDDISEAISLDASIVNDFKKTSKIDFFDKVSFYTNTVFLSKNISYVSDSYLIEGFINFSELLGFGIDKIVGTSNKSKNPDEILGFQIEYGTELDSIKVDLSDLVIKTSIHDYNSNELEFGFPNIKNHYFNDFPYLGYKGAVNFANLMVNNFLRK